MRPLTIRLLSCPRVSHDTRVWHAPPTRATSLLLARLALAPEQPIPRERLVAEIWPEADVRQGRAALRTTLWRLRQLLEPDGADKGAALLTGPDDTVGLNPAADIHCDVVAFDRAVLAVLTTPGAAATVAGAASLEAALAGWSGSLMVGFDEDWIVVERARLAGLQSEALFAVMYASAGVANWHKVLDIGQRILADDPLRESVHRRIIEAHGALGHRTLALRQFERCAELLRQELAVPPMAATIAARDRAADPKPRAPMPARTTRDFGAALQGVEEAIARLHDARRHLATAGPGRPNRSGV